MGGESVWGREIVCGREWCVGERVVYGGERE